MYFTYKILNILIFTSGRHVSRVTGNSGELSLLEQFAVLVSVHAPRLKFLLKLFQTAWLPNLPPFSMWQVLNGVISKKIHDCDAMCICECVRKRNEYIKARETVYLKRSLFAQKLYLDINVSNISIHFTFSWNYSFFPVLYCTLLNLYYTYYHRVEILFIVPVCIFLAHLTVIPRKLGTRFCVSSSPHSGHSANVHSRCSYYYFT